MLIQYNSYAAPPETRSVSRVTIGRLDGARSVAPTSPRKTSSLRLRVISCCALLAVTAAACGGTSDDNTGDDTTSSVSDDTASASDTTASASDTTISGDQPRSGGSLELAQPINPQTLDPAKLPANVLTQGALNPQFALYGALVIVDTESKDVVPHMARSVTTSDGGTSWAIELRPDLMFTDGTPYDAEAVVYNWDRIADVNIGSPFHEAISGWESYEATGPTTVTVKLSTPNTQFPRVLATGFSFIGSPTAFRDQGDDDFGSNPVGAGPFKLKEFLRDSVITLERNPDYWDAPRPYLDTVSIRPFADERQQTNAFAAGELDIYVTIQDDREFAAEHDASVLTSFGASGPNIFFNTKVAPLDDIRVRQAFLMALDSGPLCQAAQTTSNFPCDPIPNTFFPPASPFYDPASELPSVDLAAAQELIDSYVADNGNEDINVSYTYSAAGPQAQIAEVAQAQLNQLDHVNVTVEALAPAAAAEVRQSGQAQISVFGMGQPYPDPVIFDHFHSGGSLNSWTGYSRPEVDAALDTTRASLDDDEVAAAYKQVAQFLMEDAVTKVYQYSANRLIVASRVHDATLHGDIALRLDTVWIDE
jgi:peptide/nickel transport system substrate-binding protein